MERALKLAVCLFVLAGLPQVRGQGADDMVICYSEVGCRGDDLGVMLRRDCCVSTAAGMAFRPPASEICSSCVVYGFSQETLTAVEQDDAYAVSVGYWKGAGVAGLDFTLDVSSTDGTANEGVDLDYTVTTTQVEVAASAAPAEFNDVEFSLNLDGVALEANEVFTIELAVADGSTAPTGISVFFLDTLSVTIFDSDTLNISFDADMYSVVEGMGPVEVCFGTSGGNAEQLNVTVQTGMDGTAMENSDFVAIDEVFTLDPSDGATTICFDIDINDDSVYESDEQFLVTFGDISNDEVNPISQASVTIFDDDEPTVSLTPLDITVDEGDTGAKGCINFDGLIDSSSIFTVVVEPTLITEGINQATADLDFNSAAIVEQFSSSDETLQVRCFPLPVIDDDVSNEGREQFSLAITQVLPVGRITNGQIRITIVDNDVPEISIAPSSITVPEDASEVEVCITIAGGMLEGNVMVTAETSPKDGALNQATAGLDYEATTIVVNFGPSDTVTQTVCGSVSIINDTTPEPAEQFSVRLVSADPLGNLLQGDVCVTIEDDDAGLICHENAEIVDGPEGESVCTCLPGFIGDGVTACDDIDECAGPDDVCADRVSCINVDGSFKCECMEEDGTVCITRDAADMMPSPRTRSRSHSHSHTHGSGSGRSKRSQSSRSSKSSKSTKCTPKRKSRNMCGCGEGYMWDDVTCKDIDECATGENDCNDRVQCINEPGSFRCVCDCLSMEPAAITPGRSRSSGRRMNTKSGSRSSSGSGSTGTKSSSGSGTTGPRTKSRRGRGKNTKFFY